jgi:hypothetical protein
MGVAAEEAAVAEEGAVFEPATGLSEDRSYFINSVLWQVRRPTLLPRACCLALHLVYIGTG